MPLNTTSTFDTYNEKLNKQPVYVLEIEGSTPGSVVQSGGADVYFCTGDFSGITANYKKLLKRDSSAKLSDARPIEKRNYLGDYVFRILVDEANGYITDIVRSYPFKNRKVTIKYGYKELSIGDFTTLPFGYIREVAISSQEVEIFAQLAFFQAHNEILSISTETMVARTFIPGETALDVDSISLFSSSVGPNTTYDYEGQGYRPLLFIENRMYRYDNVVTSGGQFGADQFYNVFSEIVNEFPSLNPNPEITFADIDKPTLSLFTTLNETFNIYTSTLYNTTFSSDKTENAYHDAYVDISDTVFQPYHNNRVVIVSLKPHGTPTATTKTVTIRFSAIGNDNHDIQKELDYILSYDPSSTAEATFQCKLLDISADPNTRFHKLQWYDTDATLADRPTLQMMAIRGYGLNSKAIDIGTTVRQVYRMEQKTPGEGVVRLLTTTASGNNGVYDMGIAGLGMGIEASRINGKQIVKEFAKTYGSYRNGFKFPFFFYLKDEKAFPEYLYNSFMEHVKPSFFYHDAAGKVAVSIPDNLFQSPIGQVSQSLSERRTIGVPKSTIPYNEIYNTNEIIWGRDSDSIGLVPAGFDLASILVYSFGAYTGKFTIKNTSSISYHGELNALKTALSELTFSHVENSVIKAYYRRPIVLYGQESIDYYVDAFYEKGIYQTGDEVKINSNLFPDLLTSSVRGVTDIRCYIWGQEFNFDKHPKFRLRSFEAFKNRLNVHTAVGFDISISKTTLDYVTTLGAATLPEDGYAFTDISGFESDYTRFTIEMTSPGATLDKLAHVKISFGGVKSSTFLDRSDWYLPYNPSETLLQTFPLLNYSDGLASPDYWKCSFHDASVVTASHYPTLRFVQMDYAQIGSDLTLTSSTNIF